MQLTVKHDPKNHKFYAMVDGQESVLEYDEIPGKKILDYHHTYVPAALRGRRIADAIVKYALDYARDNHYQIIPSCSFVERMIDRHPEYRSLVASSL